MTARHHHIPLYVALLICLFSVEASELRIILGPRAEELQQKQTQRRLEETKQVFKDHLLDLDRFKLSKDDQDAGNSTPFFWHIPKAGGTSLQDLALCLDLVLASEVGVLNHHDGDKSLQVVEYNGGSHYLNVDTTSYNGILHAHEMGFVSEAHTLVDLVVSPLFYFAAAHLFDATHKGMLFTILRHPVQREASLFYYLQDATWENTYETDLQVMSIQDWAKSGRMESNWMTRFLVGKPEGPITEQDLNMAKGVLREKCVVGLLEEIQPSLERFGEVFGWNRNEKWNDCMKETVAHHSNAHKHPAVEWGSKDWQTIENHNQLDLQLYEYAVELFQEQLLQRP